uniref:NRF domain-containing protein n=1 Tax=Meloidogyne hapla TaxID=6305 RepID=A0A1I8BSY7_MELHA
MQLFKKQLNIRLSTISPECRSEVSQLFCSLTSFVAYLKAEECPGKEDKEQCVKCRTENERLYNANKWIMTWVDSVGKMPSGISDGNYHWLGDYEQCQRLKTQGLFNGRYCLLEFRVPGAVIRPEQCPEKGTDPLEVVLGICLPANCSTEETQGLVEYVAEHQPIHVNCQPPGQWPLAGIILVGILLLWLSVLLFVSTFRWFHHLQLPPIFDAFCLQIHLRHSLRTTQPLETRFQSIHGIQVLAASFLVLGQAQLLVLPYLENTGHHYALLERWPAQIALNPTLLTDTILALDLFQLALNESQRRPKRSLILIVWKRFLRIWPIYTLITLSMAFVFAHLGEGPMWSRTDISQRCSNNWPENIFFITPFARASSPIIGLLFALFLLPKWDEWQHLIKALSLIGLLITLFFMIFILWAPFWIFTDSTISLIYGTIHRPIWSFLLFCFLGFLEVNLKGSVLAKLLCWRVFRPLSKLVLIVLLLSEPIALSLFSSLHRPVHTTPLSSLLSFIGIFVCSFLFSFILDCSIIRPIRNLFLKIYGEKNELENNKEEENDEKEIAMEKENILGKSKNEI